MSDIRATRVMATEDCRSRKTVRSSSKDNVLQNVPSSENCNQSSCQPTMVRLMAADNGESDMTCLCPCGGSIVVPPGSKKPVVKSGVKVVTYKKKLGPDKILVVKQEMEVPRITPWILFHGVLFILFIILMFILLHMISISIAKAEEIMAVLTLLLLILVHFRPRYFLPAMVFNMNAEEEDQPFMEEERQNEQAYICCE